MSIANKCDLLYTTAHMKVLRKIKSMLIYTISRTFGIKFSILIGTSRISLLIGIKWNRNSRK